MPVIRTLAHWCLTLLRIRRLVDQLATAQCAIDLASQRIRELEEHTASSAQRIRELEEHTASSAQRIRELELLLAGSCRKIVEAQQALETSLSNNMFIKAFSLGHSLVVPSGAVFLEMETQSDFQAQGTLMQHDPSLAKLWRQSTVLRHPPYVSRFLCPTGSAQIHKISHFLADFSWDGPSLPQKLVHVFNTHLRGLTVLSRYVKKTLLDSGVTVSTGVTGAGADQILLVSPAPVPLQLCEGFRFLHSTNSAPSKGTDVLLHTYFETFTAADPVILVLTLLSPLSEQLKTLLHTLSKQHPNGPKLQILKDTVSDDGVLRTLYQQCQCFVAPGRSEGFNLGIVEAMFHSMPVITTAYGGPTDVCTEETAWLVDYQFAYTYTHLEQFDQFWAEPDRATLATQMKSVFQLYQEKAEILHKKTDCAYRHVSNQLNRLACNHRFDEYLASLDKISATKRPLVIGWVSSWQTKCGIASYSSYLLMHLEPALFKTIIYASIGEQVQVDGPNVHRCWSDHNDPDLHSMRDKILADGVDVVVIQFNFGFFDLKALADLLEELAGHSISILLFLHSTADTLLEGRHVSLSSIAQTLAGVDRIIVHNVADLNQLKCFGLVDNVTLFPQGVHLVETNTGEAARQRYNLTDKWVIGTYGFLLPHKGVVELIEAFALLCKRHNNLHLLLVNALYPHQASEETRLRCCDIIRQLGLTDQVTMINNYLDDHESLELLSACNLIVYPYQQTQESSSAAVRFAVSSQRPIACTPLEIFNDVRCFVHFLPGTNPELIARGVSALLAGGDAALHQKIPLQRNWIAQHAWPLLAQRLGNIAQGLVKAKRGYL